MDIPYQAGLCSRVVFVDSRALCAVSTTCSVVLGRVEMGKCLSVGQIKQVSAGLHLWEAAK